jgi:IclR family pca regulon transcriptional regulator
MSGGTALQPSSGRSETMGGLAKGLAIIEIFGSGASRLTVAQAAQGSGTARATARRCLLTLLELGYLTQEGRFFIPTTRLRQLGGAMSQRSRLISLAEPIIKSVSEDLDETISLAVLEDRDALWIIRADSRRMVQTGVRVGARIPAYATAAGRLLLGILSDEEIRDYLEISKIAARSPRSIVDRQLLYDMILKSRRSGVCYNDEELEIGMRSMAVAVRHRSSIVGAIGLSTLTIRASLEEMELNFRSALEEAARRLSAALG